MRNRQQNKGATFGGLNVLPKPNLKLPINNWLYKQAGRLGNKHRPGMFILHTLPHRNTEFMTDRFGQAFCQFKLVSKRILKNIFKTWKKWKSRELFKTGKRGDFKAETLLLIRRRIFQREKISKKASRSIRVEDGEDAWGFQSNRKLRSLWRLRRDESRRLLCT